MLQTDTLPHDTADLLAALRADPRLEKFILIGGTAIALHHGHRDSEDLDFRSTEARLDAAKIKATIARLVGMGYEATRIYHEEAEIQAQIDGDDLADHHQDWALTKPGGNKVKLTFFASDTNEAGKRLESVSVRHAGYIRVASSEALFEMKARLLPTRNTTRDLFDLWFYCAHRGKTLEDVFGFALSENKHITPERLRSRFVPDAQSIKDPGFHTELADAPKNFKSLRKELEMLHDGYESRRAATIAAKIIAGQSLPQLPGDIRQAIEETIFIGPADPEPGKRKVGQIRYEWAPTLTEEELTRRGELLKNKDYRKAIKETLLSTWKARDPKGFEAWEASGKKPFHSSSPASGKGRGRPGPGEE